MKLKTFIIFVLLFCFSYNIEALNLNEFFIKLDKILDQEDKNFIKERNEEDSEGFHYAIVESYYLNIMEQCSDSIWNDSIFKDYFAKQGLTNELFSERVILIAYNRHLNKKNIELDKLIRYHIESQYPSSLPEGVAKFCQEWSYRKDGIAYHFGIDAKTKERWKFDYNNGWQKVREDELIFIPPIISPDEEEDNK